MHSHSQVNNTDNNAGVGQSDGCTDAVASTATPGRRSAAPGGNDGPCGDGAPATTAQTTAAEFPSAKAATAEQALQTHQSKQQF